MRNSSIPRRDVVVRKVEEVDDCLLILLGTVRRFPPFGRTALRKLAIVPDMVPLREGIFKREGYSKPGM